MVAPNPALEKFLRAIPLFSHVEPPQMLELLRLLRPVELRAGEVLFREGAPAGAMWVLGAKAQVSVSVTPRGGKRPLEAARLAEGHVVGELSLIDDAPRSATAVVVESGSAYEISGTDFYVLRQQASPAAYQVLRRLCVELCGKLRSTTDRIVPPTAKPAASPGLSAGRRPELELLDLLPQLRPLPATVKLALSQKLSLLELSGVTPLFAENEAADAAYFVLSGELTVGRNGKTLATMGPGSLLGLVACIDGGRRTASCITAGPVRLLRLSDSDFDSLFASANRFAFSLVDAVAAQLVSHLREANGLLPAPSAANDRVPELELLPLEMELGLAEPSPG